VPNEELNLIQLVDLQAQYTTIKPEIEVALERVISRSAFILGEEVGGFEGAFAQYCGSQHAIGVASGTAALHLALAACGIGAGDDVITTPHTFIATAEAIAHTGARPVFADIDPNTYNLDPARFEAAITPQTRAVIPVHLYGRPAPMREILQTAHRHGLRVIEDACQSHGARCGDRRAGSMGDAGCFSFYPGKNLGAFGDAGIVVTDNRECAARVRALRDHGRAEKYVHDTLGYGERLDGLQAAVLDVKLRHLEDWNEKRRAAANTYRQLLAGQPLILPPEDSDQASSVYHLFVIRVRQRDRVLNALKAAGVGAGVHYPLPVHMQPAFGYLGYQRGDFPHSERAADEVLSLPLYPEITTAQLETVAAAVRDALAGSEPPAATRP
jgi:dTDP-4-amino-4,6-dideoxygalactose transaminase